MHVGKYAKQATAQLLSRPFTVTTRGTDARGNSAIGRIYAFVTTADGEDLGEEIIRNGLVLFQPGGHFAHLLGWEFFDGGFYFSNSANELILLESESSGKSGSELSPVALVTRGRFEFRHEQPATVVRLAVNKTPVEEVAPSFGAFFHGVVSEVA